MAVEAHPQLEVEGGADHGLRHCLAVPFPTTLEPSLSPLTTETPIVCTVLAIVFGSII